jgi:hypothetical protein
MRLDPPPKLGEAENVVNGFHRRFSTAPTNMWISDPSLPMPQELLLTWVEPQRVRKVTLTFDTLARQMHDDPWECGARVAPMCVKAYHLSAWVDGIWRILASDDDNHHRFRVHQFAQVETRQLRLRVNAAHGEGYGARVYQVSVCG